MQGKFDGSFGTSPARYKTNNTNNNDKANPRAAEAIGHNGLCGMPGGVRVQSFGAIMLYD